MTEDQIESEIAITSEETDETPQTVLETINFPHGISILRLPDIDGKPIYFPSFRVSSEDNSDDPLPGKRNEVLQDIGRNDMVLLGSLSKAQLKRLDYALDNLKLPVLLAVHAALNTELDLYKFPIPENDSPYPVTLAMLGRPGVGKSFMTALLSHRERFPIINLDNSSKYSSKLYKNVFEENEEPSTLSVQEGWKLTNSIRLKNNIENPWNSKTLKVSLDEALQDVLKSPHRDKLYLVDMPGIPGQYNFGTGRIHGKNRRLDLIDLVARESCESGIVSTHQLMMEPAFEGGEPHMERKIRWITDEVIKDNIENWQNVRQNFKEAVKYFSNHLDKSPTS